MKAIHLLADTVKTKAVEALLAGRLGPQSAESRKSGAGRYRYPDGSCCVIGAALTDEQAEYLDRAIESHIAWLIDHGNVITDDRAYLIALQRQHDGCMNQLIINGPVGAEPYWDKMCQLLGLNPDEHPFPKNVWLSCLGDKL